MYVYGCVIGVRYFSRNSNTTRRITIDPIAFSDLLSTFPSGEGSCKGYVATEVQGLSICHELAKRSDRGFEVGGTNCCVCGCLPAYWVSHCSSWLIGRVHEAKYEGLAGGVSLFHSSVSGPHRGGQQPSPLARCVQVDTPYQPWGTPPHRRLLSICGVTSPTGAHNSLPPFRSRAQPSSWRAHHVPPQPPCTCVRGVCIVSPFPRVAWVPPGVLGGGWRRVMDGCSHVVNVQCRVANS